VQVGSDRYGAEVDFASNPIDGLPIAYRATGAGPAIVLVHGTALSQVIWRGFGYVRDLATDHTVITLDLRGHGRSGKPHEGSAYRMELFVADVLAVLDVLEVERADYLGYSLGGRIGFAIADAFPDRIGRFVSAAGAPGNQQGAFDRLFFPGCIDILKTAGMEGFLESWQQHSGNPIDRETRAAMLANDAAALAAYMRQAEVDTGVPEHRLGTLDLPTLMLVGSEDAERLAAAKLVQATARQARLQVLPGATHGDLLWHPDARPAIRAFLAATPSPR
jgi:pimeloyl-ACP methyl ester carboxylesterase